MVPPTIIVTAPIPTATIDRSSEYSVGDPYSSVQVLGSILISIFRIRIMMFVDQKTPRYISVALVWSDVPETNKRDVVTGKNTADNIHNMFRMKIPADINSTYVKRKAWPFQK
mmetsp:Transcript_5775/g.14078  ORF Transcript_5775/g.14078 Transcript_5775/m.14078 type:complete len:113 (+) Transcript_5775:4604-4942(+)